MTAPKQPDPITMIENTRRRVLTRLYRVSLTLKDPEWVDLTGETLDHFFRNLNDLPVELLHSFDWMLSKIDDQLHVDTSEMRNLIFQQTFDLLGCESPKTARQAVT